MPATKITNEKIKEFFSRLNPKNRKKTYTPENTSPKISTPKVTTTDAKFVADLNKKNAPPSIHANNKAENKKITKEKFLSGIDKLSTVLVNPMMMPYTDEPFFSTNNSASRIKKVESSSNSLEISDNSSLSSKIFTSNFNNDICKSTQYEAQILTPPSDISSSSINSDLYPTSVSPIDKGSLYTVPPYELSLSPNNNNLISETSSNTSEATTSSTKTAVNGKTKKFFTNLANHTLMFSPYCVPVSGESYVYDTYSGNSESSFPSVSLAKQYTTPSSNTDVINNNNDLSAALAPSYINRSQSESNLNKYNNKKYCSPKNKISNRDSWYLANNTTLPNDALNIGGLSGFNRFVVLKKDRKKNILEILQDQDEEQEQSLKKGIGNNITHDQSIYSSENESLYSALELENNSLEPTSNFPQVNVQELINKKVLANDNTVDEKNVLEDSSFINNKISPINPSLEISNNDASNAESSSLNIEELIYASTLSNSVIKTDDKDILNYIENMLLDPLDSSGLSDDSFNSSITSNSGNMALSKEAQMESTIKDSNIPVYSDKATQELSVGNILESSNKTIYDTANPSLNDFSLNDDHISKIQSSANPQNDTIIHSLAYTPSLNKTEVYSSTDSSKLNNTVIHSSVVHSNVNNKIEFDNEANLLEPSISIEKSFSSNLINDYDSEIHKSGADNVLVSENSDHANINNTVIQNTNSTIKEISEEYPSTTNVDHSIASEISNPVNINNTVIQNTNTTVNEISKEDAATAHIENSVLEQENSPVTSPTVESTNDEPISLNELIPEQKNITQKTTSQLNSAKATFSQNKACINTMENDIKDINSSIDSLISTVSYVNQISNNANKNHLSILLSSLNSAYSSKYIYEKLASLNSSEFFINLCINDLNDNNKTLSEPMEIASKGSLMLAKTVIHELIQKATDIQERYYPINKSTSDDVSFGIQSLIQTLSYSKYLLDSEARPKRPKKPKAINNKKPNKEKTQKKAKVNADKHNSEMLVSAIDALKESQQNGQPYFFVIELLQSAQAQVKEAAKSIKYSKKNIVKKMVASTLSDIDDVFDSITDKCRILEHLEWLSRLDYAKKSCCDDSFKCYDDYNPTLKPSSPIYYGGGSYTAMAEDSARQYNSFCIYTLDYFVKETYTSFNDMNKKLNKEFKNILGSDKNIQNLLSETKDIINELENFKSQLSAYIIKILQSDNTKNIIIPAYDSAKNSINSLISLHKLVVTLPDEINKIILHSEEASVPYTKKEKKLLLQYRSILQKLIHRRYSMAKVLFICM